MLTEQDLQEAMADAVEDPAAEQFTLGLSDRALAEAGEGSWWRRSLRGRRRRLVPGIAVGSAFVVAAAVGVAALGGGSGGSGSGSLSALGAPSGPANPVAQSALIEFSAECFNGHGPKLALTYVWDPATQQYLGVPGDVETSFSLSPDGKRALVVRGVGMAAQSWAVADWPDAVAGHMTAHPITDETGVRWTTDGKEVVSQVVWNAVKVSGGVVLGSNAVNFYDPASGDRLASVPIPHQVRTMSASGEWSLQQFEGDHDSVLFPLLSANGDRLEYLNAQGAVVRTLTLQNGLPGNTGSGSGGQKSSLAEWAQTSPDGRYLAESNGSVLAVFDLQAGGKRIGSTDVAGYLFNGWIGDHQIMKAADEQTLHPSSTGPKIPEYGHSPVYTVLTPDMKVMQQATFVLPNDPHGACSTWPMAWGLVGQFPGAFVP